MRRLSLEIRAARGVASQVFLSCGLRPIDGLRGCDVDRVDISGGSAQNQAVYLHELGHVYNAGALYEGSDPQARGIAWIYFSKLAESGTNCPVHELYADAVQVATRPTSTTNLYFGCLPSETTPSAATLAMMRSVLAKEIPAWFNTTYAFGPDDEVPYDTSEHPDYAQAYDLEAVWEDLQAVSWDLVAIFAMRDAFGGYCNTARVRDVLFDDARFPPTNPWRAGGCVPMPPWSTCRPPGWSPCSPATTEARRFRP